jgi:hypothetical protein
MPNPIARLEGQLSEYEERLAIYRELLLDEYGTKARWAIIDAMRDHRARIEDTLDDLNY